MDIQHAPQAGGAESVEAAIETTAARFRTDVLEPSLRQLVLLEFWAPGHAGCQETNAVLERAVKAAKGKLRLARMNRDAEAQAAAQLGVRAVPAVVVFDRGRATDGFTGVLPQAQIKFFLERLVGPLEIGGDAWEEFERLSAAGELEQAEVLLAQMLEQKPVPPKALAELIKLQVASGRFDAAEAVIVGAPDAARNDPAVAAAMAALENARQASGLGELADLRRKVREAPADHQARTDLALALNAQGLREEAAAELLDIVRQDRSWNDDGARKQLIQFFDAWGPVDKATIAARRKLSSLLFS